MSEPSDLLSCDNIFTHPADRSKRKSAEGVEKVRCKTMKTDQAGDEARAALSAMISGVRSLIFECYSHQSLSLMCHVPSC